MFDLIKSFLAEKPNTPAQEVGTHDVRLCSAALLVHVLSADGVVTDEEETMLRAIVRDKFELTEAEAGKLYEQAQAAAHDSVDLYSFTSTLKNTLDEEERIKLVRHLWDVVYSDGQMHEMEDNVVWRIAELLAVSSRDRVLAKRDAARGVSTDFDRSE